MKQSKKSIIWKSIIAIIGLLIPIGLSIGLVINTKKVNSQKYILNNDIEKISYSNNEDNNELPYWDLDKITFLKNEVSFNNPVRKSNINKILRTSVIDDEQHIKNIITSAELDDLNIFNSYLNMEQIQVVNESNMINSIIKNYDYRYKTSEIEVSGWSINNFTKPSQYVYAQDANKLIDANKHVLDFGLISLTDKNNQELIKNKIDKFNLWNITNNQNNFFTYYVDNYNQLVTHNSSTEFVAAKQIVIDWKDPSFEKAEYITNGLVDFWIQILLNNKDCQRIVIKPANIIIYRDNDNVAKRRVQLNEITAYMLLNSGNDIDIDDWMNTCINEDPSSNFDFRSVIEQNNIKNIKSINIPRIININDEEYIKSKKWNEPSNIVSNILFSQNPLNPNNRSWGNNYYENLEQLFISAKFNTKPVSLFDINDIRDNETYTNAVANAGSNTIGGPIFSNEFFVCPNLKYFATNDVESFFKNYYGISYLILYKIYNSNFSDAAMQKYSNIIDVFVPEIFNDTNIYSEINKSFAFNLKNSIKDTKFSNKEIKEYINNYFNYFNVSRVTSKGQNIFNTFNSIQNQWLSSYEAYNGKYEWYRYECFPMFYDLFTNIILPFSMTSNISDEANPLYLKNNVYPITSNGSFIARYIDKSTNTIFYNSQIFIEDRVEIYPDLLLTNEAFDKLVKEKIKNAPADEKYIDITFDDWVKGGWTGISDDLDVLKVIDSNDILVNNFTIPNINIMNLNSIAKFNNYVINYDLIISVVLIILICIFVLIEIFIVIMIIKSGSKYNWVASSNNSLDFVI